ncbi:FtsX-like permease family protein [Candidatus Saccharibacteria bacterium]|nr:FtsX-like permease family protein [Candidatus Saccharibacteria bacterium]
MKTLDILRDANANLWRNKIRSFLTILAIFIGSFTIILNSAINAGVNDFMDKQISNMGGDGYLEMMPTEAYDTAMDLLGSNGVQEYTEDKDNSNASVYIKDEQIEKIDEIDGIKSFHVLANSTADYVTSDRTDKRYRLALNLVVPGISFDMSNGRTPSTEDDGPYEIAVNEDLARALGYDNVSDIVDQTVQIAVPSNLKCYTATKRSKCQTILDVKVTGTQAPGILSMGGSRASYALWSRINEINFEGMPAETNRSYQATADVEPDKIDEVKAALEEIGLKAMSVDDEVGMFRTFFDAILIVFNIFGAIALIAASIGIINTLFMSVQERTREIGLDKALGMSNGKVFFSFSAEAIMLGFWGSFVGVIISIIIGTVVSNLAHETFLKDFPTFSLTIFEPLTMIGIVAIIMLIAFLAGTLPARKASKKNPIDALRYE